MVLALTRGIICVVFGCGGPISSVFHDALLQLIDRVIIGLVLFPVGLGGLHSFAAALASADTVDIVVNAIRLASLCSLCYMFGKVTRMAIHSVAGIL